MYLHLKIYSEAIYLEIVSVDSVFEEENFQECVYNDWPIFCYK